jgi:magnesium transporter
MVRGAERLHLTLEAVEPEDPKSARPDLVRREIDMIAVPGVVVTVHRGPVLALERFSGGLSGETMLGVLDAADLLSSLADEVITGYHDVAEGIEKDIDRLDQRALRGAVKDTVLSDIVAIRRRISFVRRTLAPHRSALAALGRPEMRGEKESLGEPWPGLVERLDVALLAIESLRDALLGTYDIHMGRVAQRANDVMKALTLVSAVFLPAVVLAGIMGMNFKVPFFDEPSNFFVVCGVMAVIAFGLLVVARWRRWI